MRVVIDVNCFLAIIPKISSYRPVFDAYRRQEFELAVTTDILEEYEEIFGQKMNAEIANNLLELVGRQANTAYTEVYYRWNLIHRDPDDNKYVDCCVAAEADFIVANDKHFSNLNGIEFPMVRYMDLQNFAQLLLAKS